LEDHNPKRCLGDERLYASLCIIGFFLAYLFIGLSIASAPWFRWTKHALSDLGHALRPETALYFNFGLSISGLLIAIYAVTSLRRCSKYAGLTLTASAFSLQLVAVFDEIYGDVHTFVSEAFFILLLTSTLTYAIEKRSLIACLSFMIEIGAWLSYWIRLYNAGIAVPEIISVTAAAVWIFHSAIETLLKKYVPQ